jgi:hypothetical protein
MINIVANEIIIIIREAFYECKTNLTQLCNPKNLHIRIQIRRLRRSRITIKNNTYYGFII